MNVKEEPIAAKAKQLSIGTLALAIKVEGRTSPATYGFNDVFAVIMPETPDKTFSFTVVGQVLSPGDAPARERYTLADKPTYNLTRECFVENRWRVRNV